MLFPIAQIRLLSIVIKRKALNHLEIYYYVK